MQQTGYQELIRQQLESLDYQQLEAMMRLSEFHKENPFSPPGLLGHRLFFFHLFLHSSTLPALFLT